jgi:TP901 family phage tail tape measure protein
MSLEASMKIAVVLSVYDKMSKGINQAVRESQQKLSAFAKKASDLSDKAFKTGQTLVASGLAIGAPIIAATKKAMDFEDAMADVAKVANLDRASQQFKALSSEALKLSKYLATNASDVGTLYSSLLSGGTAIKDLSKVAKIAGEASIAFDMTQQASGDAFMVMKNAMALSVDETKKAFDATNAITNKFGGKASDILMYMSSGGASVARTLKATAPDMEAFGRALMQSGVAASEAGTVMERFRTGLYKNAAAKKIFDRAGGGANGTFAVFEAAKKSGDAFKWFQSNGFGQYASNMSLLSGNLDNLAEMLKYTGDETNYIGSAHQEFANRTTTTSFKIMQLKQAFYGVAITAGNTLLPILKKISDKLSPIMDKIANFTQKNSGLVKGVILVAAGFSAMALAGGYLSFVVGGVAKFVALGARAFSFLSGVIGFVVKAFQVLRLVMLANPIIAIIAGIAIAAFLIYKYWDKISAFFKRLWNDIKAVFYATWEWIKRMFLSYTPQGLIIKHWAQIAAFFSGMWQKIKNIFLSAFLFINNKINAIVSFIFGLGKRFYDAGANIISSIINGITSKVTHLVNKVKDVAAKIRNFFPFSPAKEGPLRDIHRVKIVETIAASIKPNVLANKMKTVTANFAGVDVKGSGSVKSGGNNFNFTINLSGGATKADGDMLSSRIKKEISQLMKQYNHQKERVSF